MSNQCSVISKKHTHPELRKWPNNKAMLDYQRTRNNGFHLHALAGIEKMKIFFNNHILYDPKEKKTRSDLEKEVPSYKKGTNTWMLFKNKGEFMDLWDDTMVEWVVSIGNLRRNRKRFISNKPISVYNRIYKLTGVESVDNLHLLCHGASVIVDFYEPQLYGFQYPIHLEGFQSPSQKNSPVYERIDLFNYTEICEDMHYGENFKGAIVEPSGGVFNQVQMGAIAELGPSNRPQNPEVTPKVGQTSTTTASATSSSQNQQHGHHKHHHHDNPLDVQPPQQEEPEVPEPPAPRAQALDDPTAKNGRKKSSKSKKKTASSTSSKERKDQLKRDKKAADQKKKEDEKFLKKAEEEERAKAIELDVERKEKARNKQEQFEKEKREMVEMEERLRRMEVEKEKVRTRVAERNEENQAKWMSMFFTIRSPGGIPDYVRYGSFVIATGNLAEVISEQWKIIIHKKSDENLISTLNIIVDIVSFLEELKVCLYLCNSVLSLYELGPISAQETTRDGIIKMTQFVAIYYVVYVDVIGSLEGNALSLGSQLFSGSKFERAIPQLLGSIDLLMTDYLTVADLTCKFDVLIDDRNKIFDSITGSEILKTTLVDLFNTNIKLYLVAEELLYIKEDILKKKLDMLELLQNARDNSELPTGWTSILMDLEEEEKTSWSKNKLIRESLDAINLTNDQNEVVLVNLKGDGNPDSHIYSIGAKKEDFHLSGTIIPLSTLN